TDWGANDSGTLFRISEDGAFTQVYSFPREDNGLVGPPLHMLAAAADGSVYGVVNGFGAYGTGRFFRVAPDGTFEPDVFRIPGRTGVFTFGPDGSLYGIVEVLSGSDVDALLYRRLPDGNISYLLNFNLPSGAFALSVAPDGTVFGMAPGLRATGDVDSCMAYRLDGGGFSI